MKGHETWRSGVIWRAAQSAPRGCGLHTGRARDDCGPFGSCRQRAGARRTAAAPCRDRARAVAALDLTGPTRDALVESARAPAAQPAVDELSGVSLPLPPTALLGRDADVQTLRHWLADPAARLITLIGPGGVGKTRLALELARAIADEGQPASCSCRWPPFEIPRSSRSAIAEALGLSDVTRSICRSARAPRARIAPTLLVLDNFEQVLDAAPLVADLLTSVAVASAAGHQPRAAPRARRAGVRRRTARVGGWTRRRCRPPIWRASPAVRLFVERVRDVQPDFRLTSANGPTVTAICRRLDALPLALELAAPWIKVLTAEDLLRRLEHDVLLSTVGPRDLPERQQTMNATVAWSYQLLGPDEQRAFRRLGALPGRFPIDAAAAVLAGRDGPSAAQRRRTRRGGRLDRQEPSAASRDLGGATRPLYQMLETVRAYAALELTAAGERDDALEGLVRYCTGEASLAAEGLVGPAQVEWLDRVRDDLESYRGALTWLIEHGRAAEASDIAWGLMFFWVIRGHAAEGLRWYEQILSWPSLPPAAESRALVGAALMWYTQGELERARAGLTRALRARRARRRLGVGRARREPVRARRTRRAATSTPPATGLPAASRHSGHWRSRGAPGSALSGLAECRPGDRRSAEAERLLDEATSVLRHAGPWFLMSDAVCPRHPGGAAREPR